MAIAEKKPFGKTKDGKEVSLYVLKNAGGTSAGFINYGARWVSMIVKDAKGVPVDVVLGYGDAETYGKDDKFMGAIAGRCANRIGHARFTLNGKEYFLAKNDGGNHLHGGLEGFDKKYWNCEEDGGSLLFSYTSPAGEENYPGTLAVKVRYSLSDEDELSIDYEAVTDEDTICNLTNHAYFNLDGCGSGSILRQKLQIYADRYTRADKELIPDGRILPVEGTPLDFRTLTDIGSRIGEDSEDLRFGRGYDHNWCIRDDETAGRTEDGQAIRPAAHTEGVRSGITMDVLTTMPGIQFYSGNFMDGGLEGKGGARFGHREGFCLETQYYPNATEHPEFPQPILRKGDVWRSRTVYRFGVKE